eukprot:CAMPEP_0174231364 /NCGR_PEP_ID=MMETSP0417-20130205/1912_1 /TAXON_ID=242541 /ORGANISM="Mayorella sp, Strain BSH-02190019" /LENGTH=330 /DNA_ID=CAMNT_0015309239 /DNA_START=194 /DNA_END=1186 /DNA_ORIENTATION=-
MTSFSSDVNGTSLADVEPDGSFKRRPSSFRGQVSDAHDAEFPVEAGRYRLYVSYACPWASRCLAFRSLLGLQEAIALSVVHPVFQRFEDGFNGWGFAAADGGSASPNTIACPLGSRSVRDLYLKHHPEYEGRFTVPVLFDMKQRRIVNNESSEIIRLFHGPMRSLATRPDVNLLPADRLPEIDRLNERYYNSVNNGVYRCGFATTQAAYEKPFHELFDALDEIESLLAKQRFLVGDTLTETDIRVFVTLVRFDVVYYGHFKCNKKHVYEYPNIWNWVLDVYQTEGIAETVEFEHIKQHYYSSHRSINPHGVVPLGPALDFRAPHDRATKF